MRNDSAFGQAGCTAGIQNYQPVFAVGNLGWLVGWLVSKVFLVLLAKCDRLGNVNIQ